MAVLGAGIMGSCLALFLARSRFDVTLFDAAAAPLAGVSRWNEGKIHLGFLYAADPALRTARCLLPGGLAFAPLISELIDGALTDVTPDGDIILVHRASIVDADAMRVYFRAVSDLVRQAPNADRYLGDVSKASVRALSGAEIAGIANSEEIVAGFRVPERSVRTVTLADRLCQALAAERRVHLRMGVRITAARAVEGADAWRVSGEGTDDEVFDWVINALWHGKLEIDLTAGLAPQPGWSHRYRVSVFARTPRPLSMPSVVVALGPFGDMKNYNGRDFYLSWYPAGLLSESATIAPRPPRSLDPAAQQRLVTEIREGLARTIPRAREILDCAESVTLEGGYVFAQGQGSLADPAATLHRRDRFGIQRRGRYISIDTGKYSTAPLMARTLASEMADA